MLSIKPPDIFEFNLTGLMEVDKCQQTANYENACYYFNVQVKLYGFVAYCP